MGAVRKLYRFGFLAMGVSFGFSFPAGSAAAQADVSRPPDGDPTCVANCSHLLVALLQSRSTGEEPDFEVATLDMMFRLGNLAGIRLISLASLDIAVTKNEVSSEGGDAGDDLSPESQDLTDAGLTLAIPVKVEGGSREILFGSMVRIFQTDPLGGLMVGSLETGEELYGSRFAMGWVWPFIRSPRATKHLAAQNFFAEFLFRFPRGRDETESIIGLLRHLSFRGTVLIPNDDDMDILAKIAVIVPLRAPFLF